MPGPWRILSQVINGRRMYIARRQKDLSEPLQKVPGILDGIDLPPREPYLQEGESGFGDTSEEALAELLRGAAPRAEPERDGSLSSEWLEGVIAVTDPRIVDLGGRICMFVVSVYVDQEALDAALRPVMYSMHKYAGLLGTI